jgi:type IV secretory pathway VirB10-like protein
LLGGLANLLQMPSAKRKSGRNPLQRLNDQRRSLALVGLAAGAVASAAILRRKRHGGEAEFERPQPVPPPVAPTSQPDSGPPAAVDVPPPAASLPEVAPAPEVAPENAPPVDSASSSTVEPATGELSAEEASILAVLAQHGRTDDDRTAIAVATSLERETTDVTDVLRKLGAEGVVAGELYTAAGDKIWAVTERGVRRLGAQS